MTPKSASTLTHLSLTKLLRKDEEPDEPAFWSRIACAGAGATDRSAPATRCPLTVSGDRDAPVVRICTMCFVLRNMNVKNRGDLPKRERDGVAY